VITHVRANDWSTLDTQPLSKMAAKLAFKKQLSELKKAHSTANQIG
jgi:hypothetical protein